ncbi:hypothetical protein AAVH_16011 [Aphelenchoides avenae]|nr:hypothetical protein AAVH_16011 [Aphelenchus avenae]
MSLWCGRGNDAHKSAFVKSSYLRWILGELQFNDSLPRPDYIHLLIELGSLTSFVGLNHLFPTQHFRESSSPDSMRCVDFSPDKILYEYVSPSCHLPGAYIEFFPCPHCTHTVEEDDEYEETFVEVFHFANVHKPNVCATVTFITPAVTTLTDAMHWKEHTGCWLEVELTKVEPSARWRILRVLTTRGLSQALCVVCSHLRNAFVTVAFPLFDNSVPPPGPPCDVLVDIPLPLRINWLASLLHSIPRNAVISHWFVDDAAIRVDNLLPLARCALTPHWKLGCVRELELVLWYSTWAQLANLLNQRGVRRFNEITFTTIMTIDTSELRAIISSRQSPKLHLIVLRETESQDPLQTLPAQLVGDFVALADVSTFVTEFSLRLAHIRSPAFSEMPNVNDATIRRKRFRCHLQDVDTVVRVHVYANLGSRKCLTVVTFDHFRRTVRFFKGNVPLADLKLALQRHYEFY